ncbi:carbohydrate binding [Branchiostoma belcheri]|nr:carbohydrate binding [Branchiostoma belcheri]
MGAGPGGKAGSTGVLGHPELRERRGPWGRLVDLSGFGVQGHLALWERLVSLVLPGAWAREGAHGAGRPCVCRASWYNWTEWAQGDWMPTIEESGRDLLPRRRYPRHAPKRRLQHAYSKHDFKILYVDFWFGLHDQRKEGLFEWVDGTPLGAFQSWGLNQPDDYENSEDCVVYWGFGGHRTNWNDAPCSRELRFICEFHRNGEDTGFSSIPKPGSSGRPGPEKGPMGPAGPVSAGPPGTTGQNVPKGLDANHRRKVALPCTSGPGTCYKAFIDRKEFKTAAETCCREGGTLAMPRDRISSRRIANMLIRYHTYEFWIGLHDQLKEGHFEWVDGTPLGAFQRWAPGQPDGDEGEDCATYWVYGAGGQCTNWNDAPCSRKLYFICDFHPKGEVTGFSSIPKSGPVKGPMGPAGPVSAGPPGTAGQNGPKWTGCQPSKKVTPCYHRRWFSKTCYMPYNRQREDFNTAAETCCRDGGTLAMPRDADSNKRIATVFRRFVNADVEFWIGLHDQHKEGHFEWVDGTPLGGFTSWAPNQPDDDEGEDCAAYWGYTMRGQHERWNDAPCSRKLLFICEFHRK